MTFDFDTPVDRRGTNSMKWNIPDGELPMWIADMDFKTAPPVLEALRRRMDNGVFGYTEIPDAWAESYVFWWTSRHHLNCRAEWFIFTTGVIPAISSSVRKLTTPAEKVVIQTPVYNIFFNSIINNGRYVLESPLAYDGREYSVDWEDLEKKLSDPQTSMMILCNPHNPVGKIWDRETLARIGGLCAQYGVTVISDEIHCDLTDPGTEYVPFASVNETCRDISVTCMAPTKAFNIAGTQSAAVMIPNPLLRHKVWRALNTDEVAEPNAFAVDAAIAAFNEGGPWLDALREYIAGNKALVRRFLEENIPGIRAVPSQATYLLWLDCSALTDDSRAFAEFIRRETGLFLADGVQYGESGRKFLRMNVACPRSFVEDGLDRLKKAVSRWE